jgi:hypothetical protein
MKGRSAEISSNNTLDFPTDPSQTLNASRGRLIIRNRAKDLVPYAIGTRDLAYAER